MVRKKAANQRNTLALWAGIQPDKGSSILVFKIASDKLRNHQKHVHSIEKQTSKSESEATISDSLLSQPCDTPDVVTTSISSSFTNRSLHHASVLSHEPPKAVHPFFQKANPSDSVDKSVKKSSTVEVEPHSFFKPRCPTTSKHDDKTTPIKTHIPAQSACMPSKEMMHVYADASTHLFQGSQPLQRRCKDVAVNTFDDWKSSSWWKAMKQRIGAVDDVVPSDAQPHNVPTTPFQTLRYRHHGAIQAIASDQSTSGPDPGALWTSKYAPRSSAAVLQLGSEALLLRDWLQSRQSRSRERLQFATKRNILGQNKYADAYDDFIVDEESLPPTSDIGAPFDETSVPCPAGRELLFSSNVVILVGPSGSGKSALVNAVATELELEVFEVNSSDRRSGKDVVDMIGEAADSHIVNKQRTTSGAKTRSLLLFEEVDVLYREDKDFWPAVLSLITRSRRPIVLTCSDTALLPHQLDIHDIFVELPLPDTQLVLDYLEVLARRESVSISRKDLLTLLDGRGGDLRACLLSLQFQALKDFKQPREGIADRIGDYTSRNIPLPSLYSYSKDIAAGRLSRSFHRRYLFYVDALSMFDVMSHQKRTIAFESPEVYENEDEDTNARLAEKDDVTGRTILSDPHGRYTQQHPGDLDLTIPMAVMLKDIHQTALMGNYPISYLSELPRPQDDINEACDATWARTLDACEPFAVPENWMHDTIPHNSIDRPRQSGILSTEITPYLREIVRVETSRSEWEQLHLSTQGRQTRNTISAEFGSAFMRPPRIPVSLRPPIAATFIT